MSRVPLLNADASNSREPEPATFFYRIRHGELVRACLAEFIVTLLFVLLGVTAVVNVSGNVTGAALAHGLLIFLLVAMTANVSGGHVNPAVSLGVCLSGEISFVKFLLYFASQMLGASVGGALALAVNVEAELTGVRYGTHHPAADYNTGRAFGIEIFTTFVLVTTVLANAVDRKGFQGIAPLCIGLAVAAGILVSGRLTGGSMNPARSFGSAMSSLQVLTSGDTGMSARTYYQTYWQDQWLYILAPLLGATVAAVNFRFVLCSHALNRVFFK